MVDANDILFYIFVCLFFLIIIIIILYKPVRNWIHHQRNKSQYKKQFINHTKTRNTMADLQEERRQREKEIIQSKYFQNLLAHNTNYLHDIKIHVPHDVHAPKHGYDTETTIPSSSSSDNDNDDDVYNTRLDTIVYRNENDSESDSDRSNELP
jgi:uncharacterized membrane protein YhiD involved in acid resistance